MAPIDPIFPSILYLCKSEPVSRTQLNKLLFFCDLAYFIHTNRIETITNETYLKYQYGPVPMNIDSVRNSLIGEGLLNVKVHTEFNYEYITTYQYQTSDEKVYIRSARLLGEEKTGIIDLIYDSLKSFKATKLSQISHYFKPWKEAGWYEQVSFANCKDDDPAVIFIKEILASN